MSFPVVSIIVPVYNAEDALERCVKSIINQTYRNWELLLIDDGSLDSSGSICDKYADFDKRIHVYHKENGGVSSARNFGLDVAQGEFVTFIDADDYVVENFLEKMYANTPADLVICGFFNSQSTLFKPDVENLNLSKDMKHIKKLFDIPYYLDTPWCKFFKMDIIQNINLRFDPKVKLSEDTLFCYEYISNVCSVNILADTLYYYEGIWGGGSKYKLTIDQQEYMSEKITSAINRAKTKFNTHIDDRFRGFHPSKIEDIYTTYQDKDIYSLYIKYYNTIPIGVFLGDGRSPLSQGIITAINLVKKGQYKQSRILLKKLNRFLTTPFSQIVFCSKQIKIACWLMRNIGATGTTLILKMISFKK